MSSFHISLNVLTHWVWVTHICISKLTIIGSDNGLSPHRHQAIIWTSAGILLIGPLGTNFSEILIEIYIFSFKKMHLKTSAKWLPFCPDLSVLMEVLLYCICCMLWSFGSGDTQVEWQYRWLSQRSRLRRPISKICRILLMDAKMWMVPLIIIFAVCSICTQDAIFKMSSVSPGLVQECSNSIANAMELLQSCTKPSISLCVCIYVYICSCTCIFFLK